VITLFAYDHAEERERQARPEELEELIGKEGVYLWLDITAPTPADFELVRKNFPFHPLALEDAQSKRHHPKLDEYKDHLFLIVHGVHDDATPERYKPVQLALFLGQRYLVTFHPQMDEVKEIAARCAQEPLLANGPGRLTHQLFDRVVDEFMPLMAQIEERVHYVEEQVFRPQTTQLLEEVFALKRTLAYVRQTANHQREILSRLTHNNHFSKILGSEDQIFFKDIYDHVVRVIDQVDSLREIVSTVVEANVSLASQRLNEVMKVLTVFSSIFLPLTFIAGIYGMNFDIMPELRQSWGYPAVLLVMLLIVGAMVSYFKKKNWF
jgi:magnesium transporter